MDKKNILIILLLISILIVSQYVLSVNNNDNETKQLLELNLTKTNYLPNKSLEGELIINFDQKVSPDEVLTINFEDQTLSYTIEELLEEIKIDFNKSDEIITVGNLVPAIEMTFSGNNRAKEFGFVLPKDAEVLSVDFSVKGDTYNSIPPKYPRIDTGINNDNELEYFGSFQTWNCTFRTATGFNENSPVQPIVLEGDSSNSHIGESFCELVNVPRTKHLKISGKYKTISGTDPWVLEASVKQTNNPQDNTISCSLPQATTTETWNSCGIPEQVFVYQGNYYICIDVVGGTEDSYAELLYENTVTKPDESTGYRCDAGQCNYAKPNDYYIKYQTANYNNNLRTKVSASDWLTLENAFNSAIEGYLYGCIPYDPSGTLCVIPNLVNVSSQGIITLSDLEIKYVTSAGTSIQNLFSTISIIPEEITHINKQAINNYSLVIPLLFFPNLTTQDGGIKTIAINFMKNTTEAEYNVSSPQDVSEEVIDDGLRRISNIENSLDSLTSTPAKNDILNLLNVDVAIAKNQLKSFKSNLESLQDTNESGEIKLQRAENINKEVENLVANTPSTITLKTSVKGMQQITLSDIPSSLGDTNEILAQQDKFTIFYEVTPLDLKYFSEQTETKSLVMKVIKPLEPVSNGEIYEIIDKVAANDLTKIKFSETPNVVQADPIVKFNYPNVKQVTYLVDGDISNQARNLITLIIPSGTTTTPQPICGDGLCNLGETETSCPNDCKEELPLYLIIIASVLVVLIIAGIVGYKLYYYKSNQVPFKTAQDYQKVTNFILKMIDMKKSKAEIFKQLKSKGWTEVQINHAYNSALKMNKSQS